MWFSRYIRWRDKGQCYTCPKRDDPKRMQCGHFVPRQYLATRFSELNCRCQCYACNVLYNGQASAFASRLEGECPGIVDNLELRRRGIVKDFPYEDMIVKYKALAIAAGWVK